MKTFLLLFLVFTQCVRVQSQSDTDRYFGKISYDRVLNFEGTPSTEKYTLLIGPESSVFFETEVSADDNSKFAATPGDDGELTLSFHLTFNSVRLIMITDFSTDLILTQTTLLKDGGPKVFLVKERRTDIDWQIRSEYKTLSGIKVQKAIGDFRGRRYVAWFATDIPVKAGPFKFSGLPGLILSIADERNEVLFHATAVKVPLDGETVPDDVITFRDDATPVTFEEYLKLDSEQVEEMKKLIMSKFPRGSKAEFTGTTSSNGIELEYEGEVIR